MLKFNPSIAKWIAVVSVRRAEATSLPTVRVMNAEAAEGSDLPEVWHT